MYFVNKTEAISFLRRDWYLNTCTFHLEGGDREKYPRTTFVVVRGYELNWVDKKISST